MSLTADSIAGFAGALRAEMAQGAPPFGRNDGKIVGGT